MNCRLCAALAARSGQACGAGLPARLATIIGVLLAQRQVEPARSCAPDLPTAEGAPGARALGCRVSERDIHIGGVALPVLGGCGSRLNMGTELAVVTIQGKQFPSLRAVMTVAHRVLGLSGHARFPALRGTRSRGER